MGTWNTKITGNEEGNVEYYRLQTDLKNLLGMIIPGGSLSITDFIGLLGYNETLEFDRILAPISMFDVQSHRASRPAPVLPSSVRS